MSELYSLPDKLELLADESLAGLAMRYAALYGLRPERLFDRLGFGRRTLQAMVGLDPKSSDGRAVAALLNLTPEQAQVKTTWAPMIHAVTIGGHMLNVHLSETDVRQCCPLCLEASPHHRSFWLIAAVPICPEHALMLDRQCPQCNHKLNWGGPGPMFCADPLCNFDLRESSLRPVSEGARAAAAGLRAIYDGRRHPSGLTLDEMMQATLALGRLVLRIGQNDQLSLSSFVRSRRDEAPQTLAAGWAVLDPWPSAYHAFLSGLLAERKSEVVVPGLKAAFGEIYDLLRHRRGWRRHLYGELSRYAVGRADIAIKKGKLVASAARDVASNDRYSLGEIGQKLGVSYHAANRIAADLGAPRAMAKRSGKYMIDAAAIEKLAKSELFTGALLSAKDVSCMLGVSEITVKQFVRVGVLAEVPPTERIRLYKRFRRLDVEAILAAFESAAVSLPKFDELKAGFRRSGGGGSRDGFGTTTIVAGVLAGKLAPVAIWTGGKGITRYLFAHKHGTPGKSSK